MYSFAGEVYQRIEWGKDARDERLKAVISTPKIPATGAVTARDAILPF